MEEGAQEARQAPSTSAPAHSNDLRRDEGDEDEVAETDPEGRYYRYSEVVGRGRFKQIFKAFDTQIGIDVAWSKIAAEPHHLSEEQLSAIAGEMTKGLELQHPNIIKCFKCWEDHDRHCINLITELFTSGNLRQYRNLHKQLDLKAVKRMGRHILKGLEYLHSMNPPVVHGDLRCDKIYVNGHTGEIKIGDLGLATLLPYRWDEADSCEGGVSGGGASGEASTGVAGVGASEGGCGSGGDGAGCPGSPGASPAAADVTGDIFAFGLCMLELLTLKQLDPQHCCLLPELVSEVADAEAARFISACVGPAEERPSAGQLLEDAFMQVKKAPPPEPSKEPTPSTSEAIAAEGDEEGRISIGKLRGEDYNFEFHGKVRDGKMHFRLYMTGVGDGPSGISGSGTGGGGASGAGGGGGGVVRTIDFVFDPDVDTADNLASEISEEFSLSPTDTEICAAALREWLAKEMPGSEGNK